MFFLFFFYWTNIVQQKIQSKKKMNVICALVNDCKKQDLVAKKRAVTALCSYLITHGGPFLVRHDKFRAVVREKLAEMIQINKWVCYKCTTNCCAMYFFKSLFPNHEIAQDNDVSSCCDGLVDVASDMFHNLVQQKNTNESAYATCAAIVGGCHLLTKQTPRMDTQAHVKHIESSCLRLSRMREPTPFLCNTLQSRRRKRNLLPSSETVRMMSYMSQLKSLSSARYNLRKRQRVNYKV